MESFDSNKIVEASFDIIFNAGEARTKCELALKALETFDFENAEENLKAAKKEIVKAHQKQTEIIQSYIGDMEGQPFYMIFSHAQDTLMTINSEILIAQHLAKITKALFEKIK